MKKNLCLALTSGLLCSLSSAAWNVPKWRHFEASVQARLINPTETFIVGERGWVGLQCDWKRPRTLFCSGIGGGFRRPSRERNGFLGGYARARVVDRREGLSKCGWRVGAEGMYGRMHGALGTYGLLRPSEGGKGAFVEKRWGVGAQLTPYTGRVSPVFFAACTKVEGLPGFQSPQWLWRAGLGFDWKLPYLNCIAVEPRFTWDELESGPWLGASFSATVKIFSKGGRADNVLSTPPIYEPHYLAGGADPNEREPRAMSPAECTPLILAVRDNQPERVAALLAGGADPNERNSQAISPIGEAISMSRTGILNTLLDNGANPALCSFDSGYGIHDAEWSPLASAIRRGNTEIIDALTDALLKKGKGADINQKECVTPLLAAVNEEKIGLVERLLEGGADPNLVDVTGYTPFFWAVYKENTEIIDALLKKNADPNFPDSKISRTPLVMVVQSGNLELVQRLLESGANPNPQYALQTPLVVAAGEGNLKIVECLLESGANLNPQYASQTPLICAVEKGRLGIVKCLLAHKADPNLLDVRGRSPLFAELDAYQPNIKIINALLEGGADPESLNDKKKRLLDEMKKHD